jgi:WD40 repeat protein
VGPHAGSQHGRPRTVTPSLESHRDAIDDVTFSPNGNTVVTTGNDGSLVVWDLEPLRHMLADSAAEACRVAGPIDPQEWSRYLPDRAYIDTCAV